MVSPNAMVKRLKPRRPLTLTKPRALLAHVLRLHVRLVKCPPGLTLLTFKTLIVMACKYCSKRTRGVPVHGRSFHSHTDQSTNTDPLSLPCHCSQLLQHHPDLRTIDGHVACSASLLAVPDHIATYFAFSSKSTVFANWHAFQQLYRKPVWAWFYAQGFPDAVFHVLVQEWCNHELALREDPSRLQQNHVSKILKSLQKSLVFHLADHQATHLMIFCPQFYFQSVLRVRQDPTNFIQVHQSPERCKIQIHGSIPGALRQKYAWGINANARLPQGFVLKEKKEFRKGRSVIAYNGTVTEKLQRGTTSAIEQMIHMFSV